MRIHKEGFGIIRNTSAVCAVIIVLSVLFLNQTLAIIIAIAAIAALLFVVRFFRVPKRTIESQDGVVYAPADGTVVVIEKTTENECLNQECIQVSVFMSVWNIHINWFPVGGTVEYFKHHHGKFLVAWHPKSSEENERTTTVVNTGHEKILFRQIAGMVARRIVSYAKVGNKADQNSQCGFIKFGSRVDLFLPLESEICVSLDQKVKGTQTIIARLKR